MPPKCTATSLTCNNGCAEEDASEALARFEAEIEPRLLPGAGDLAWLAEWVNKLAGKIARVAALLHLAEHGASGPQAVAARTMDAAIRIGRYFLAHAEAAYRAMRREPALANAEALLSYLRRLDGEVFSARDLHRKANGCAAFRTAESVKSALETLEAHQYVRRVASQSKPGPGRSPSEQYRINPLWTQS